MVEDAAVTGCLGVMELVDDHHVEPGRVQLRQGLGVQRLYGREHMLPVSGPVPGDEQLTESAVGQHLAIGAQALFENLAAMRHEEQAGPRSAGGGEPLVVQRGHHRLTCAGGRDDEVAVAVVHLALDLQRLQHPILVRPRADLEPQDGQRGGLAGPPRRLG